MAAACRTGGATSVLHAQWAYIARGLILAA
jgi:hypothetical protein